MVVVLVSVETAAGPSTPSDGCGGASPVAPLEGVSVLVAGGLVTSGGAFW